MRLTKNRWGAFALTAALCTAPVRGAMAQIVDEEGVGRLSIGPTLGYSLTSMSDVNSNISVTNDFLAREEIRDMDKVRSGLLTGLDVRYKLGQTPLEPGADEEETISLLERFSIGFTWGAVNSESGFEVSRATTRFYARSTTYTPYLLYHVPWIERSIPRSSLYFGAGPMILSSIKVEWAVGDSTNNDFMDEGDLSEVAGSSRASGSALGAQFQAGCSFMLNTRFSVALDAGYRMAKLSDVELEAADGQEKRFAGDDDEGPQTTVRRPGDWSVIDFFKRSPDAVHQGRERPDPQEEGGCAECPLYYSGGATEIDFSGFFSTLSFRVHF